MKVLLPTMTLSHLVILVLLFLSLSAFSNAQKEELVGQYTPIQNLGDPHVRDIANYAVAEYNKRTRSKLELEQILNGEYQVVAGINYKLVLMAKKPPNFSGNYQAIVYEKPWESFRNLTSFIRLLKH